MVQPLRLLQHNPVTTPSNPSLAIEQEIDILTLIPQRPPIVMVDRLEHYDPVDTLTSLTVRADNPFVERGRLSAYGLTENIAQSCAARIGYLNHTHGEEVRIGVIGAIRDLQIHALPPVGTKLTTSIKLLEEVFQMTLVGAEIHDSEGTLIASATMKIALR